uniref:Fatty acyl-CoA reductase n=1 Tax=Streltzoviella insularis TaxID=1206366 RepID=A0A7D5YJV0_9NEOP|nr:fatty acyl-CoA reductase 12 [Streltzoviella insularis]
MVARVMSSGPQIPQFYAGRSILITGGTGFMGKVLVERILATCPDVGRLFLLMRPKKNSSPEVRLLQLKQSQVFDVIRQNNPKQLDKIVTIAGDVEQPGLGLNSGALQLLQEVSVVFHAAATLKFDEELKKAVDMNLRSVVALLEMCDKLPHIEAFVHVSTAYSNADQDVVEERVYPAPTDMAQLLALADAAPADLLKLITPKYIAPKPNTYTYTKAMAESAVNRYPGRGYPVAIFRPTIVVSSLRYPFPGWVENLNGPSGVVVGAGKGMLHVFCCRESARADLLPVDIAIDTLIAVAWEIATDRPLEAVVYNCSTGENPITWHRFETTLWRAMREYPMDAPLWYPSGTTFENRYVLKTYEFLLQTAPLHLAEYVARLLRIKKRLSLIIASQKLSAMNDVLTFFSLREWQFKNERVRKLRARLSPQDAAIYNLDPNTIEWDEHCYNFVRGTRKYLLKEKDQDLEAAKRHVHRMYILHNAVKLISSILLLRVVLQNKFARKFVYGTLRLLLSLFSALFARLTPSALQKLKI